VRGRNSSCKGVKGQCGAVRAVRKMQMPTYLDLEKGLPTMAGTTKYFQLFRVSFAAQKGNGAGGGDPGFMYVNARPALESKGWKSKLSCNLCNFCHSKRG